jgi:hypothetical protein
VIYVGIDDTDTKDAPGTNQLVRWLVGRLAPRFASIMAVRHQLLVDPRIPYTSKNSSASILFRSSGSRARADLVVEIRRHLTDRFIEGSDPGFCVTERVPPEVIELGARCQREVVTQEEARRLAREHAIHLEGIGGTEDGVIGALAGVGLAATGNDGRVVHLGSWPDDLCGPQDVGLLRERGIAEIRPVDSNGPILQGRVDVGKHLRPNYRGGRIVLFVARSHEAASSGPDWRAVRFT